MQYILTRLRVFDKLQLTLINQNVDFGGSKSVSPFLYSDKEWRDELLTWNSSQHGGVRKITLPDARVWTPDLTVYNQ